VQSEEQAENLVRPFEVTLIGWYAVVMGVLGAVVVPFVLWRMNGIFATLGGQPHGWNRFVLAASCASVMQIVQAVSGVAILKGRNWGRFAFALVCPVMLIANLIVCGVHVPLGRLLSSVYANLVFTIFLFLPRSSGYFRSARVPSSNNCCIESVTQDGG